MGNGLEYTRKTTSVDTTKQLAATLAPYLRAGDVIVLSGDIGAGKTHFVQGVAHGLGVDGAVTSPTFNILYRYQSQTNPQACLLHHFDLYRIETLEELENIGFYEVIEGDGASFIEWGEKFPEALPYSYLEVHFTVGEDSARTVKARAYGDRARQLLFVWAQDSKSRLVKIS